MKKLLSLIFTFILIIQPSFGFGIYKKIDFEKDSEPRASKILYEHMLKFENKTPEELKDFANIYPESVKAVEIDLNDDGKKRSCRFDSFHLLHGNSRSFIIYSTVRKQ